MNLARCVLALTLGLAACSRPNPRVVTAVNETAALVGDIPVNPLQWRVITSGVDPRGSTMFTLFGNDAAVQQARRGQIVGYPAGSRLALVTWQQQEDVRWFGGQVPGQVRSMELIDVQTAPGGHRLNLYRVYQGLPLKEAANPQMDRRTSWILSLRAAVMP